MRFFLSALRAAALCAVVALAPAFAQSVILSPAVVPLAGSTGQSVTQVLTLQNASDQPLEFKLEAEDVVVRDGARAFVRAGKLPDSIAASAVFTPARITVPAHSSGAVTATFTLPPSVRHRAVLAYFRGTREVRAAGRNAIVSLGSLFTFTLSDRHSVRAGDLVATPPTVSSNAQLTSTLVNDGDEPEVPTGMAVILDAAGQLVGKAPFAARRLLPGESLAVTAEYAGELPPGAYRVVATFDVAGRPLSLSATLDVK
jgi:hypothetical protein